jgi:hypothetical protein
LRVQRKRDEHGEAIKRILENFAYEHARMKTELLSNTTEVLIVIACCLHIK